MSGDGHREVFRGRYLRVLNQGGWEHVERVHSTGVVAILAVTDEGRVILAEQFRVPVGARVIELPAGLAGDVAGQEGEPLEEAARRELLEETGYEAGELARLISGPTSAGLTSESITLFLASELRKLGDGGGDDSEDIEVHEVALAEVHDFLLAKMAAGVLVDPKVFSGLYFAQRLA